MAPTVPTTEPLTFIRGDTVKWTRSWGDFPVGDGWAVTYHLRGANALDIVGTPGTNDFSFSIAAADCAKLGPGTYQWQARATLGGESYAAGAGVLTVTPGIRLAAAGDMVSADEQLLAVLEAACSGRVTADIQAYTIGGRQIQKIPVTELFALRGKVRALVRRQRNAGQLGQTVRGTFGPVSEGSGAAAVPLGLNVGSAGWGW